MNAAQVRAKARMAMKRREEDIEQEEIEGGELNLVPYLDIVTNVMLFLLATITAGFVLGNINSALPEYAESAAAVNQQNKQDDEPPVQLVVAVTKKELLMFSLSGQEGTLQAPKLRVPAKEQGVSYDFQQLTDAAAEIVKRRWPSKDDRPENSREVILMADGEIPYNLVVATMDALRQAKDGMILFPDILFSTGIQ
ncbi:MAG: biopolymer transporter ExbD [Deltaproteobacteria bacterium]|nr:biopolymer transporter ExbD [Deltaproteobacteria bacterium]